MGKIDCATCQCLRTLFFKNQISETTRNSILVHLIACSECYEWYQKKAVELEVDFNILDEYFDNPKLLDTSEDLQARIEESLEEFAKSEEAKELLGDYSKDKWTTIAQSYDVCKLFKLKAFKDMTCEYDFTNDSGTVDYVPFYKHLILKIAQKIDHLEECLCKEFTDARP